MKITTNGTNNNLEKDNQYTASSFPLNKIFKFIEFSRILKHEFVSKKKMQTYMAPSSNKSSTLQVAESIALYGIWLPLLEKTTMTDYKNEQLLHS